MAKLAKWMPGLIRSIDWGLSKSLSLSQLKRENEGLMTVGRSICLDLWPFIEKLPENVVAVRDCLPDTMNAARKLLDQLADEERYYQKLYIKQCLLAGLSENDLSCAQPGKATEDLCRVMASYAKGKNYCDGIYVIVTAELAAAAFSRIALPVFESYFARNAALYNEADVSSGLEWLQLHAKPQTRHALWLKTMLQDIGEFSEEKMPKAVESMLKAIFALWRCPSETSVPTYAGKLSLV